MENNQEFSSIVTHFDLDGVASAALCSYIFNIEEIRFCGPSTVDLQLVDNKTIICDLPYPRTCGLWFDHHIANKDELALRNIDVKELPGRLENKPSCMRVIYDFFVPEYNIEEWEPFVKEVDVIDGFLYNSPEEWRKKTPGKILESSIKFNIKDRQFLHQLTMMLRENDYIQASKDHDVLKRAEDFWKTEDSQIELIRRSATFLGDKKEIIVLNLTEYQKPPAIQRNFAFTIYPESSAVIEIRCQYENGKKTNDLYFSMSLGFTDEHIKNKKNIGEIMRILNIGGGHAGAAAGQVKCNSKVERIKNLEKTLKDIGDIWESQK